MREAFDDKPLINPMDETENFNNYLRSKIHNTRILNTKTMRRSVDISRSGLEGIREKSNIREHD